MSEETKNIYFESTEVLPDMGFQIRFVTMKHNSPLHWHREMEILYILNGSAVVTIEGKRYKLDPMEMIVIDSSVIHDVVYELPQTMGICIHISKSDMRRYLADIELLHIVCCKDKLLPQQKEAYDKLCRYLKELTVLYFEQKQSYALASSALILQIMAVLVEQFSEPAPESLNVSDVDNLARVEQVFNFVEQNYQEPIALQDAADELGLNKEYFCRFFKKNTGMSFLQYVNEVRLNHIYQDLLYTEGSVQQIMEKNGAYNTKLFYRLFKETYQCTPRELKRMIKENPDMLERASYQRI